MCKQCVAITADRFSFKEYSCPSLQILLDEESLQRERELVREKPEQHSNHGKPSPLRELCFLRIPSNLESSLEVSFVVAAPTHPPSPPILFYKDAP